MTENMKVQEAAASADIWSWNLMKSWGKKIVRNQTTPFWMWILELNREVVKFWTP